MTALYNEIDPFAAAWLRELIKADHIAPGVVVEDSIEDLTPDDLRPFTQVHLFAGIGVWSYALRRVGWPDDRPIWTGSCPCQPFSAAGKGGGFDDERHLWPAFFHLVTQCRPPVIVGEQVASKDGLAWLDLVQADLEGAGHAFGAVDLCAAGVGAPHIRQRLWWVGKRMADADEQAGSRWGIQRPRQSDGPGVGAARERPAGFCPTSRLEHGQQQGLQGQCGNGHDSDQPGRLDAEPDRPIAPASSTGWMADDQHEQRPQPARRGDDTGRRQQEPTAATGLCGDSGPGPTNGFWRDADWLFCRDGKWRPVEPSYVEVVDGATRSVGYCGYGGGRSSAGEKEEVNAGRVLQALWQGTDAQKIWEALRGSEGVFPSEVLRSILYGKSLRRADQEPQPEKLQETVRQTPGYAVRGLREDENPSAQSPREHGSDAERWVEFGNVVRQVSRLTSLAELRSDYRSAATLSLLRFAIREKSNVLHASISDEAVWASLGEKEKDQIRLGFDAFRWRRVGTFPLVVGAEARVGRLRGYGNAIVAQAAEAFLTAALINDNHGADDMRGQDDG